MKVVSLFAGCGGLDLGLIQAGHKILYASDIDKDCQLTYEYNIGKHFHLEDVYNLDTKKLPKFDLLVGGFPCQGFSVANLYRSKEDKRNHLYTQLVRVLNETTPNFFLFENVPGILSLEKGVVVEMIQKEFETIGSDSNFFGYEVKRFLLNAADYGVPQNRKRVIFLGISKEVNCELRNKMFLNFPPKSTHTSNSNNCLIPHKTLKDTIADLPEPYTQEAKKIFNQIGTNHKVKINGYMGNRALDWNKPSPTIVGRGGGTGGPVIAVHPNLQRRFTVRETARIQTFPDNFVFLGATTSQFRQIGNAIAVEFGRHLGLALNNIELIYKKESKKNSKTLVLENVD
jgi:DNA (cytosine-5)-methyltransferase 1